MKRILSVLTAWVLVSSTYAAVFTPHTLGRQDVVRQSAVSAKADTVNVIGKDIDEKEYYSRLGEWYVSFYNLEQTMHVRLDYKSTSFTGTFTTQDFAMAFIKDYSSGNEQTIRFDSIAATIAETKDFTDIHAIGRTKEGVIYNMHMRKNNYTPKAEVNLTFPNVTCQARNDWFQFVGNSETDGSILLKVSNKTGTPAGKYVTADFYPLKADTSGFMYTDKTGKVIHYIDAEATITFANRVYTIDASMTGSDTVRYNVKMTYSLPVPDDTVQIDIRNLKATDNTGMTGSFWLQGSNSDWTVQLMVDADAMRTGTYNVTLSRLMDNATRTMADVSDATVEVTAGKEMTAHAKVYGNNRTLYDIHMAYIIPNAKDSLSITIPNAEMVNLLSNSTYQLHGMTADNAYYVSIVPMTKQVAGTFTAKNLLEEYSCIQYPDADNHVVQVSFIDGSVTATMSADSVITMQGRLLGSDTVLYKITMTGKYAEEVVRLEYDEMEGEVNKTYTADDDLSFDTAYVNKYHEMYVSLTAADGSDMTSLIFFVGHTDPVITIPEGVYPINGSEKDNTVLASPGVAGAQVSPSFYGHLNADKVVTSPVFFLVSGTITVLNKNGHLYMEINAHNSYDRPVHIVYTQSDTAVEDVISTCAPRKTIENGQLIILRNNERFSVSGSKIR